MILIGTKLTRKERQKPLPKTAMNKTVIITGASRGIGKATAIKFASQGYNVVLNSLTGGAALDEAARLCHEAFLNIHHNTEICLDAPESLDGAPIDQMMSPSGSNTLSSTILKIQGDVSDPSFADKLISDSYYQFGKIDVLINNAGISFVGLIQDTDNSIWQKIINTNLSSVHYCTRAVIPCMLKEKTGRIINISSVWGNVGASCEVAYSASKGGINAYTKAAAKELAPSGISINAIACGCIDTDMNKCFSKEDLEAVANEIPVGRLGTAEEAAEAIYAASLLPTYLTGQIITMDGGWT